MATWFARYHDVHWGFEGLMTDAVLTAFATNARWCGVEDTKGSVVNTWYWRDTHGEEVLHILAELDEKVAQERNEAKRMRIEVQKEETAARNAAKVQRKREEQAQKKAQRQEESAKRKNEKARIKLEKQQQRKLQREQETVQREITTIHPISSANITNVHFTLMWPLYKS
jgi:Skp family chaperone for outer membrane proteins